jgi:hypothetical protein
MAVTRKGQTMGSTVPETPVTRLAPRVRWELIQQWWEGIVQGCDFATTHRGARIFNAFRQVLMAMPEHDLWVFLEQNPLLILKDTHIDGSVFWLHVPPQDEFEDGEATDEEPPDAHEEYPHKAAIYLNARILDEDQPYVAHIVAHEIGHLVLPAASRESRVDKYTARLGFPPPAETRAAAGG